MRQLEHLLGHLDPAGVAGLADPPQPLGRLARVGAVVEARRRTPGPFWSKATAAGPQPETAPSALDSLTQARLAPLQLSDAHEPTR